MVLEDQTGAESGPNLDQNGTILFHGDSGQGFIFYFFVRPGQALGNLGLQQAFYDELKFRELLKWIHSTFDSNKYPIYVTENGMSTNNADLTNGTDFDPNLEDGFRIEFYNGEYLRYFSISNQQKTVFQIILAKCTVQ